MPTIKKWRNVRGTLVLECGLYPDGVWATEQRQYKNGEWIVTRKAIPEIVVQELKELFPSDDYMEYSFEMEICFTSSGYYDPGVLSGPPERCYPPEGDDERLLDEEVIVSFIGEEKTKRLSQKASEELFETFIDEIQEQELDDWDESPDDRY